MKTVKYKLWIQIEKITTTDENETYENLDQEETRSVGTFDTLEDAYEQMNMLGDFHQQDGNL